MTVALRETHVLFVGTPIFGSTVNYDFDPRPYLLVERVDIAERTVNIYFAYTSEAAKNIREIYGQPSYVIVGAEIENNIFNQKYIINFFLQDLDFNESFQIINEKNVFQGNTRYYLATAPEFRKYVRNKTFEVSSSKNIITLRRFEHILKGALQWQVFLVDNELFTSSHYQYITNLLNKIDESNEETKDGIYAAITNLQTDWKVLIENIIHVMGQANPLMFSYKELFELSLKTLFEQTIDIEGTNNLLKDFITDTFDPDDYEDRQQKLRNIISKKRKLLRNPSKKYLNVLVIAASGSGKTTFINSLANYLKHNTLDEAKNNVQILIPTEITLKTTTKEVRIRAGVVKEEESSEDCKSYILATENHVYHFIQAPSYVDDHKKNKKISKMIYKFLNNIQINAVCVVLKANDSNPSGVGFTRLVNEITNIHETVSKNIFVCMTHASKSDFKGAESWSNLVENVKGVETQFFKTFYSFDNECFRYLISHREVDYSEEERRSFEMKWDKSLAEAKRLFDDLASI